jgi:peptide/nickel transport system ATP-binding protein
MAMVFQEPMTALNPLHRVGDQVAEGLRLHRGLSRSAARAETLRLLDRVRLPQAASRVDAYPHQLSGGQRQRVLLAIALACAPALLIADEATTALDPGLQREVLDLLMSFVVDDAMGLVLISHDLALMAERSDTLLVMYAGCIVESGPTRDVLAMRAHPYTQGLFRSRARLDLPPRTRLPTIPGRVPALGRAGPGCPFADRCALVDADCRIALPAAVSVGPSHRARCIRIDAAHTHRAGAETSPVQEGT